MLKAPIRFEFLGRFCVRHGKREISRFRTYKTGVLLAYLAFYGDRSHPREALIEMLWPECDPALGRNSLSQSLSSLRRQLEPPGVASGEVIRADRHNVGLEPAAYLTDAAEFEKNCRRFEKATRETARAAAFSDLYRAYAGDFLPGFYEDWTLREAERLEMLFFRMLLRRAAQLEKRGDLRTALEYTRRAVGIDHLSEPAHLRLIRLYAAEGRTARALRQYEELCRLLKKELGVEPSAEIRALAAELRSGLPAKTRISAAPEKKKRPRPPATKEAFRPPAAPVSSGILTMIAGETGDRQEELKKMIFRHRGDISREEPDLIVALFASAADALACAAGLRHLAVREKDAAEEAGGFSRAAIHLGEIKQSRRSKKHPPARDLEQHTLALLNAAHAGQVLCSEAAAGLLLNNLEPDVALTELGSYRLGAEAEKTERVFQVDRQLAGGAGPQEFPPLRAEAAYESNLPLQLSRFFGREAETGRLSAWLDPADPAQRLISLTGPGGTGKTRLSIEVAAALQEAYRNRVWFVSLTSLEEPGLIPNAILEAMRLDASAARDPLDYLATVLARRPSLLVLDNFEHLLGDAPPAEDESVRIVLTLLERIPALRLLMTTRRKLGVFGENEFFLGPLPVPAAKDTVTEIGRCESVRLFVDRAQTVRPTFQLTKTNAGAIAELCRRLEGIPLALELAAARIQMLTPARILRGLERRLDFLTDRRRQAEIRHQQLRAAIDWSFQLLAPEVGEFFAMLSIFREGGNLTAVENVSAEPLALDYLASLQDFSFLRVEENEFADDLRFVFLETLREYGAEKLSAEKRAELRERHARHFLRVAENGASFLKGGEQVIWLRRLERDHQNFLSALDWCLETGDAETGLRLVIALCPFWEAHGHIHLGREKINAFRRLPESERVAPRIRAAVLACAGNLAISASAFGTARELFEKSLEISRREEDIAGQAAAYNGLGRAAFEQGDYEAAYGWDKKSIKLRRQLNDEYGLAASLNNLGLIASERGDYPKAIGHYRESLEIRRRIGDRRGIAVLLNNMGIVYRRQGDYKAARRAFGESLDIRRELEDRRNVAASLSNLSWVAENECDYEAALEFQEESYAIRRDLGDDWGIALSHNVLGILAHHRGDAPAARRHFEESLAIRRRLGNKLGLAETLFYYGDLLSNEGEFERAGELIRESIGLMAEIENRLGLAEALEACSRLALNTGRAERSAVILAAARSLRQKIGARLTPSARAGLERQTARLREVLTAEKLRKAREQGAAMPLGEAVALACRP